MAELHAPVLEMLWESHDPNLALDARFGFTDGRAAGRWIAATLEQRWAVRIQSCDRIVMSDQNALVWVTTPSGRLLAKWSVAPERFPRLREIARLTHWLGSRGLPVSAPVPTRDGNLQIEVDGVSLGLQREIRGSLLDADDRHQTRAAGAGLAHLHDALAVYPAADQVIAPASRTRPLADRVIDWLNSDSEHVPPVARDRLHCLVDEAPPGPLPTQLVHGDFRSANVLCAGATIAAVIDFEEARLDHRVNELARSAVMLGTRFRNWGPVSADVRATFLSGYESVRRLTPLEAAWWDILVLWQTLGITPRGDDPTGWGQSALSHVADLDRHRRITQRDP